MIYFVTGNEMKFREFFEIMDGLSTEQLYEIRRENIDLTEIQGTSDEICAAKCKEAARILNTPVIVEDVSLELDALNGMPGPYIKHFLHSLGQENIFELTSRCKNSSATAICTYAYFNPYDQDQKQPILFSAKIDGDICEPRPKNNTLTNWDPIFVPYDHNRTFAEMPKHIKNSISHRAKAIKKLKAYLDTYSK